MNNSSARAFGVLCVLGMAGVAAAAEPPREPVYDIPKLDGMAIDGSEADWADRGFRVEIMTSRDRSLPTADLDGRFRLGWCEKGLLLLLSVRDDKVVEDPNAIPSGDSLEICAAAGLGSPMHVHLGVRPGLESRACKPGHKFFERRPPAARGVPLTVELASARTADGYVVECLLPWSNLGVEAKEGATAAFSLFVNDIDEKGEARAQQIWYPGGWASSETRSMYAVRLAKAPSPAVGAVAKGDYERMRRLKVDVTALGSWAGKKVQLLESPLEATGAGVTEIARPRVLGDSALTASKEMTARSAAEFVLPVPPPPGEFGALYVRVEGNAPIKLDLRGLNWLRQKALDTAPLAAPTVFAGKRWPAIDFEQPSLMEDVLGPYKLKTTYYDANYSVAAAPERPGRYGALAELASQGGLSKQWLLTLYRVPKNLDWWRGGLSVGAVKLPEELGIDPAVAGEQADALADFAREGVAANFLRDRGAGVLLAWLAETRPGAGKATGRTGPWATDQRWWLPLRRKLGLVRHKYLAFTPAGYDADKDKKWPLMLFLHGAGERSDSVESVKKNGPPKIVQTRKDFPFVLVAPVCPRNEWWKPVELADLLDEAMAKYRVDPDRVYVTGLSMGGYGTWEMLAACPERIAAAAPICGGGDPADAARMKDVPIWIFHGDKDAAVPFGRSEKMFDALRKISGRVKFTAYAGVGHNSWDAAYDNEELYKWMLAQKRGKPEQARASEDAKAEVVKEK